MKKKGKKTKDGKETRKMKSQKGQTHSHGRDRPELGHTDLQ